MFVKEFSRGSFEALIRPIVDRTVAPVKQALADAPRLRQLLGPELGTERQEFARRPSVVPECLLEGLVGFTPRRSHLSVVRSADLAAWKPHIPWTAPPGGVEDEQMNNRGFGVE